MHRVCVGVLCRRWLSITECLGAMTQTLKVLFVLSCRRWVVAADGI